MDEKKPTKDTYHPFTGKDKPNAQLGKDGNPILPSQTMEMVRAYGNARRFKGFPKAGKGNVRYDLQRIQKEYMESEIVDWQAYCGTRGYNPRLYSIPWQRWVREKKYKNAWNSVKDELESEGLQLGPRALLKQVRAVRQIPETLTAMLSLIQHAIKTHQMEIQMDNIRWKQHQEQGTMPASKDLHFSASAGDLACLSSAAKSVGELLYKSLGIDASVGVSAQKWVNMVETELGQMERVADPGDQRNLVQVEIIGGGDVRDAIKEAMSKYLDPVGAQEELNAVEKPEDLAEEPEELTPQEEAEENADFIG